MKNIVYYLLAILIAFVSHNPVNAQVNKGNNSFLLKGVINADTGTVLLLPIGGEEFDPNKSNTYTAKIKQGRFSFNGQMAYPCSYLLAFFPTYVSSPFIIEAGSQTIVCHVDSARKVPEIHNRSMRELRTMPVNFFSSLTYSRDRRTRLLNYIKQHPNSYVALWETVRQIDVGYVPILDSIYNEFSASLKTTATGKTIARRLKVSKTTSIGRKFPTWTVLDTNQKPVIIPSRQLSSYTLVDFWYARCSACIADFPKLKEVFDTYKDKGFTITSVSTDKKVDIDLWKKTILKQNLIWNQYLDLAGKFTSNQLLINSFPSNFLLDANGVIIKRNIRPGELSQFLSEKL